MVAEGQVILLINALRKKRTPPTSMERFDMTIRNQKTTDTSADIRPAQAHQLSDAELQLVSGGADFTIMPVPGVDVIKPDPVCIYPFPDVPPPSDIRGPFVG